MKKPYSLLQYMANQMIPMKINLVSNEFYFKVKENAIPYRFTRILTYQLLLLMMLEYSN
jgi:hypothetical protein